MTEKVKLTQEQAEAIEVVRTIIIPLEFANILKGLSAADILQAIKEGYEVDPQIQHGDWVKAVLQGNDYIAYGKIDTEAFDDFVFDYIKQDNEWGRIRKHKDDLELMTAEEIKFEKNRRLWKSIGRKVAEFKKGDIRILDNGNSVHITDVDYARAKYIQGSLKGFYPVESFIAFESEEEE